MPARAQHAQTHTNTQARVSFRRIEEFLSRSADDVRNEEAYGKMDSDRHCSDLKKGQLKIENGEARVRGSPPPRERRTLSYVVVAAFHDCAVESSVCQGNVKRNRSW